MVAATLWMAQPQYMREMHTWGFNGLYRGIVRDTVYRFRVCEECLRHDGVCESWIDYVLEQYARATGETFGRKTRTERTIAEAMATLGLQGPVTPEAVQRSFRQAVLKAHPDLGGSADAVQRVIEARDTLLSELAR